MVLAAAGVTTAIIVVASRCLASYGLANAHDDQALAADDALATY
jgi:hypothetical protein